jgi:hypothetical protein
LPAGAEWVIGKMMTKRGLCQGWMPQQGRPDDLCLDHGQRMPLDSKDSRIE